MTNISSKNNDKIKEIIKFRDDRKYRDLHSIYFVEGERNIADINKDYITEIFIVESKVEEYKYIYNKLDENKVYILTDEVFDKISSTVNTQGIACLSKFVPNVSLDNIHNYKNIVMLDNISDPGNLGTIIRTCEASGTNLIIISNDSCDIYNPKTLRACMSSLSRVNVRISDDLLTDLDKLKTDSFNIYATSLNDKKNSIYNINFKNKNCVIFGNEANGIKKEILNKYTNVYIPMNGSIESLNVASSVSVVCFEIMRQQLQ